MIRREPCVACPYRLDVASGVWAESEYDKLPLYDAETVEQPPNVFGCHATPEHLCHGWAVVHSNRGHAFELLALRLYMLIHGGEEIPTAAVPLFSSGGEAALHGLADLEDPSPEAKATIERLLRKYGRLREG